MKRLLKTIYEIVPFKKQFFSLIKVFNPSEKIYQHLHFKGVFTVKVEKASFKMRHYGYQLENDLFWKGLNHFEATTLNLWKELAKKSNTILDVGANTGTFSLVAGAANPGAKIFAFEPLQDIYGKMTSNFRLNHFNIEPYQIAIGDKNGDVTFYVSSEYDSSLNANHRKGAKQVTVQAKTLDSFISENKLMPDLVKIDVERYEPEVIQGFLKGIAAHHPTMIVEVLDEQIAARLWELLKDSQYLFFSINDETREITRMDKLQKHDGFNVLICTKEVAKGLEL